MRRFLSLTLLLLFSLPLIAPLFAFGETSENNLPACCRRDGAHHCAMSPEQQAARESGPHVTTVHSKCPMYPQAAAAAHHAPVTIHPSALLFAEVVSHPAVFRQAEAWARVALAGARHKRGPPAVRLS